MFTEMKKEVAQVCPEVANWMVPSCEANPKYPFCPEGRGCCGRVLSFDGLYYTTPPKSPLALDSRPSSDTDVAWALRNWTAWNWLSGGQFVEQIVHTIDGMVWSMNEQLPLAAFGSGGRAQRRDDGDVWDHYDVYFEYDHNVTAHISCRQWVGCHGEIVDRTICEKGMLVTPYRPYIQANNRWRFRGERGNMYADTHVAFYRFLRSGTWTQTLESAANKTLAAIMGREAAHTGQRITWEQIKKSTARLMPEDLTMDTPLPPARAAPTIATTPASPTSCRRSTCPRWPRSAACRACPSRLSRASTIACTSPCTSSSCRCSHSRTPAWC